MAKSKAHRADRHLQKEEDEAATAALDDTFRQLVAGPALGALVRAKGVKACALLPAAACVLHVKGPGIRFALGCYVHPLGSTDVHRPPLLPPAVAALFAAVSLAPHVTGVTMAVLDSAGQHDRRCDGSWKACWTCSETGPKQELRDCGARGSPAS